MPPPTKPNVAVILAGAVAKGAFEAGVLSVLAASNVQVTRIVAASAGALNGVGFAAGVRAGREKEAAEQLVKLWLDHGRWQDVFHARLMDALIKRDGISDQKKLLGFLHTCVEPLLAVANPTPIDLRIVVAPLAGARGSIGSRPATTYEQMLPFTGDDFGDQQRLDAMFAAAVASAAFPIAFIPAEAVGVGKCVDGGIVNNTPIKWALGNDIDAIVVVSPTVELATSAPGLLHYSELVGQVAEMLINERLYRDLREAQSVNTELAALEALCPSVLTPEQLRRVKAAVGWNAAKVIKIVQVRPLEALPGSAFSGFFDDDKRVEYVRVGVDRAETVLGLEGWLG